MKTLLKVLTLSVVASCVAAPVTSGTRPQPRPEVTCLADTLYHEARGESLEGVLAVAEVVINRTQDLRFSDGVCEVVAEPGQFTWFGRGFPIEEMDRYQELVVLARAILKEEVSLPNTEATFFHRVGSKPRWGLNLELVATIGNHRFYK